jgi:hypothetical protein
MESFIAKEDIKTGDMVVSEKGYIRRARPSDPKPNRIEKLPTTWQPNKDVIVIKVNELIDAINELQEAVKPAEGEYVPKFLREGQLAVFSAREISTKEDKARLEGKIEGLEKADIIAGHIGHGVGGSLRKLFEEEITSLKEELKK